MHNKTAYKNTPDPRLIDEIGATNLTLADAVAEIVANSFDAAIDGEKTEVDVRITSDEVCIIDNGIGMTEEVLVEAVRLGKDMSKVVDRRPEAKGHFGLGMKTACASIGRWWSVRTRPRDSEFEYGVIFDLAEWVRRPDDADAWTIEVETWNPPPEDSPLSDRAHGTAVTVRRLRNKNPMSGAVLDKLGEAFKPHLGQNDSITVNGDLATPHIYHFVADSKVPIDLVFGTDDQYRIEGWVALDRQTHNDGDYGFNIYRHGQLVQTWFQEPWFRSHLMTSRIIGEVSVDFIDATFFKLGLQQSDLWHQASAEMKEFLKPVVKASRELSRKGNINSPTISKEIIRSMHVDIGIEPPDSVKGGEGPTGGDTGSPEGGTAGGGGTRTQPPKIRVGRRSLGLDDGTEIVLSTVERESSNVGTPFDYLMDGTTLLTVVFTNHPLYEKTKDLDQLRLIATADSILRYLIEERALSARKAAEIRNKWILADMGTTGSEGDS